MVERVLADAVPERSFAQRMEALERANAVRSYRADLKRELADGRRSVVDVLGASDSRLSTMKVFELMLAAPKIGRTKASKMLVACAISPSKTISGLSDRQRRELVAVLRGAPLPVRRW